MKWTTTAERMPPEGATVMARSAMGSEQPLRRLGDKWFFPDLSTYASVTVVMWRYLEREEY